VRWCLVVVAACGSSSSTSQDATLDQCSAELVDLGAWGAPTPLTALNSPAGDGGPAPTDDGLELYFSSTRQPGLGEADLYRVTRTSVDAAWGAVEPLATLATQFNETTPALSHDGLTMWFTSDRGGSDDIWVSSRADRGSDWGAPIVVTELSSAGIDYGASPFLGDLNMLLVTNGGFAIAQRLQPGDRWQTPVALAAPQTTGPGWMSPCGLELDFEVDNAFYVAQRKSTFDAFGPEQPIAELLGGAETLRLSPDRHHAYLSSDGDLYEAVR
jgi:hypothetical protein